MVKVELPDSMGTVEFDRGRWKASNETLGIVIDIAMASYLSSPGDISDPDFFAASYLIKQWGGGDIVSHDDPGIRDINLKPGKPVNAGSLADILRESVGKSLGEKLLKEISEKGGPGSGNFAHAGRVGKVGGSAPGEGRGLSKDEFTRLKEIRSKLAAVRKSAMSGELMNDDQKERVRELNDYIKSWGERREKYESAMEFHSQKVKDLKRQLLLDKKELTATGKAMEEIQRNRDKMTADDYAAEGKAILDAYDKLGLAVDKGNNDIEYEQEQVTHWKVERNKAIDEVAIGRNNLAFTYLDASKNSEAEISALVDEAMPIMMKQAEHDRRLLVKYNGSSTDNDADYQEKLRGLDAKISLLYIGGSKNEDEKLQRYAEIKRLKTEKRELENEKIRDSLTPKGKAMLDDIEKTRVDLESVDPKDRQAVRDLEDALSRKMIKLNNYRFSLDQEARNNYLYQPYNRKIVDAITIDNPDSLPELNQAKWGAEEFGKLVGSRVDVGDHKMTIAIDPKKNWEIDRMSCGDTQINVVRHIVNDSKDFSHELGHWLEDKDPVVGAAARTYLKRRIGSESPQSLRELTGNKSFADYEIAVKDKFLDAYMGKIYSTGHTEIISMGMSYYAGNPTTLASQDPDYFNFIYSILRL
jgi:hypothetical protein